MTLFHLCSLACSCNPAGTSGHANECHSQTGNCRCLSHVTGRDCSYCEVGFFNLQPGLGCERYTCPWSSCVHGNDNRAHKLNVLLRYCFSFPSPLQVQVQSSRLVVRHLPPNHGTVCVSFRSGGETVWCVSRGLLWILVTRLQRCRSLLKTSPLHSAPPSIHTHWGRV